MTAVSGELQIIIMVTQFDIMLIVTADGPVVIAALSYPGADAIARPLRSPNIHRQPSYPASFSTPCKTSSCAMRPFNALNAVSKPPMKNRMSITSI